MRKAASQRARVLFSTLVLMVVFLFSVSVALAYSVDPSKPVSGDQDAGDFIAGNIRIEGTDAIGTVVNHGNDNVKIGLASYTKVDEDIENQTLFASTESDLGPGETKDLRVAVPCWSQVDLFRIFPERPGQDGGVITSFKGNVRYGQRLISAVHTTNDCNGNGGSEPTASPSATPVASASPEPTATPTNPPQGGSAPASDGRSDNLGCSVKDCSGNAVGGASVGTVAGVSTTTGQMLPSTGTASLLNALMVGLGIFGTGLGLRRIANDLER
jgi:hypothetical protein